LVVLVIELNAFHMPGKHSTTWATSSAFFALVIFQFAFTDCIFAQSQPQTVIFQSIWNYNPSVFLISASQVVEYSCMLPLLTLHEISLAPCISSLIFPSVVSNLLVIWFIDSNVNYDILYFISFSFYFQIYQARPMLIVSSSFFVSIKFNQIYLFCNLYLIIPISVAFVVQL
jgi:hypothetical protein